MSKKLIIALLAVAVLAPSAMAKDPEKLLAKGQIAEKEGRLEEAGEIYGLVVREWPENGKAHLLLAGCLAKQGRFDEALDRVREAAVRAGDAEEALAAARNMEHRILEHRARMAAREAEDRALAKELGRLEIELRERGLRGEELEKAFEARKAKLLAEREIQRVEESALRAEELYRELGLEESELARRREVIERRRAELEAMQRRAEEIRRHGSELDRRRSELEEALRRREEMRWREERGDDLDAARREFIELAERLGVPGEAARRLLEEHHERRRQVSPEPVKGLRREIDGVRHELEEVRRHVEALIEKLNAAFAEMRDRDEMRAHESKARFLELEERIERLEAEIGKKR